MKPKRLEGPEKDEPEAATPDPALPSFTMQHMSKHRKRRERRAKYHEMLRTELSSEEQFLKRFKAVLFSKKGEDFAPDGNRIKADFFGAIREWQKTDPQSAHACLSLIEKVLHPQSARACLSLVE